MGTLAYAVIFEIDRLNSGIICLGGVGNACVAAAVVVLCPMQCAVLDAFSVKGVIILEVFKPDLPFVTFSLEILSGHARHCTFEISDSNAVK